MSQHKSEPNFFAAFFGFKRMVSPFFITLLYFAGLIGIVISIGIALWQGPQVISVSMAMLNLPDIAQMIIGYGAIILGGLLMILIWRFFCESMIVLFGIFNRMDDIKSLLLDKPVPATPDPAPQEIKATNPPPVTDLPDNPTLAENTSPQAVEQQPKPAEDSGRVRRRRR